MLISITVAPIMSCVQRRRPNRDKYARLEWVTNDALQLQRLAHEEAGFGVWSLADNDIPVTRKGERLAPLDLTDPTHPRLRSSVPRESDGNDRSSPKESDGIVLPYPWFGPRRGNADVGLPEDERTIVAERQQSTSTERCVEMRENVPASQQLIEENA